MRQRRAAVSILPEHEGDLPLFEQRSCGGGTTGGFFLPSRRRSRRGVGVHGAGFGWVPFRAVLALAAAFLLGLTLLAHRDRGGDAPPATNRSPNESSWHSHPHHEGRHKRRTASEKKKVRGGKYLGSREGEPAVARRDEEDGFGLEKPVRRSPKRSRDGAAAPRESDDRGLPRLGDGGAGRTGQSYSIVECPNNSTSPLKIGYLNDDYCDCPDGSDEPDTSACSHLLVGQATFRCKDGIGTVFASRVGDKVRDCEDGSDEEIVTS